MMLKILRCVLLLTALAISAGAATSGANYTVNAAGGGNYTTIQACASAISAGDTCTVYAGTYNEHPSIPAGAAGSYKTITVNGSDTVTVQGFTISSHVKVNGFHIQNTSSPTTSCVSVPSNTTDFYITNNVMTSCGGINEATGGTVSHGFIQGNTLSYASTTPGANNNGPGLSIWGDYHLIENNDISHVSDGFHFGGSHNVIRKNTMHDTSPSECTVGGHGENCHIDFIESEPSEPTAYNVYEANTVINDPGPSGHAFLLQADVCGGNCRTVIVRFNTIAHVGAAGVENDNQWPYIRVYNNSWVDPASNGQGGGTNDFSNGANNGADFNDLFYYPGSITNQNAICASGCGGTNPTGFKAGHNLAWCTGTPCSIFGYGYESGHWTDDTTNRLSDPQFVGYSSTGLGNLSLQSGSPAAGAGTYLTTVASSDSGSGTSLVVSDANFFQDGSGIPGVNADCIAVGSTTTHVCISSVNYQTNTLTLTSSITRAAGAPVWLYSDSTGRTVLNGSAPNIGASVTSSGGGGSGGTPPAAPTGLAAIVN
ncbi:MAG TPA: hypothetical protein VFA90_20595 [Terriglobales bacterium]|nr:hypothetical protein [Terriglobales bacterium]